MTVSDGLLGQIVVDDDGVLAVIAEPLTHRGTSEGGDVSALVSIVSLSCEGCGRSYWRGAASEAVAATMMEYFMASFSSRVWTS